MDTSVYQNFKLHVVDFVGLTKDAIHIHLGLAVFIAAVLIWRRGKVSPDCLIPVLLLAFGMEFVDLYDDYQSVGYMRWANSIHDILNTSVWPILIVIIFRTKTKIRKNL